MSSRTPIAPGTSSCPNSIWESCSTSRIADPSLDDAADPSAGVEPSTPVGNTADAGSRPSLSLRTDRPIPESIVSDRLRVTWYGVTIFLSSAFLLVLEILAGR
jgi:hypothetical protein